MRLMPLPTLVPILLSCSKGHFDTQFPYPWRILDLQGNSMFEADDLSRRLDSQTTQFTVVSSIQGFLMFMRKRLFRTDHENLMKPRYDPDSGNLEPSLTPSRICPFVFSQILFFSGGI